MREYLQFSDRPQRTPLTNSTAREDHQGTALIEDMRPEAAVQRRLASLANGDSLATAIQLGPSVIQRVVKFNELETSKPIEENPKYAIDPTDRTVLYSTVGGAAPMPKGLYKEGTDFGPQGQDNLSEVYSTWRANVRLLSKDETLEFDTRIRGTTNAQRFAESSEDQREKQEYDTTALLSAVEARSLFERIEKEESDHMGKGEMGFVGKNDCRTWASQLRMAIASQLGGENEEVKGDNLKPDLAKGDIPTMNIGDQMTHYLDNRSWPYHGATVVAKDGEVLVTLEAHAGQDLKYPSFHFRKGVAGFAADNATGQESERGSPGRDVRIERAASSKRQAQEQLEKNAMILTMYENGETTDLTALSTFIHQIKRVMPKN